MQELVKHTQDAMEKENLRLALDAMRVSSHTWGDSHIHSGQCCTVPPRHTLTPMGNTSPHHKATGLYDKLFIASPLRTLICCGHSCLPGGG